MRERKYEHGFVVGFFFTSGDSRDDRVVVYRVATKDRFEEKPT